jgi:hypothetical protein
VKGKPWSLEKERKLRELVVSGADAAKIAAAFGKSKDAILKKCNRLGLEVVDAVKMTQTTTSKLDLSMDLPSVEEALKMLNAALHALDAPGLDKSETMRLRTIIQGARIYKELLADYINYRAIEAKLVELEAKYARIQREKGKGDAPKPNPASVV